MFYGLNEDKKTRFWRLCPKKQAYVKGIVIALDLKHFCISAALRHELVVGAHLGDFTVFNKDDAVAETSAGKPV